MESSHSRVAAAESNGAISEGCAGAFVFGADTANGVKGAAGGSGGVFACAGLGIGGAVGPCGNAVAAKISMIKTSQNRFIGRP